MYSAGAAALVVGRQGINRTTLVFAWLVLVATTGFIYLAGRVGERERVWRPSAKVQSEFLHLAPYSLTDDTPGETELNRRDARTDREYQAGVYWRWPQSPTE